MENVDLDTLKIKLILNTRRINRKLDLVEVSNMMHRLKQSLNSTKAVSKEIRLSEEMTREFLSIKNLPEEIKKLLKMRKIESIDLAYRLSLLNNYEDQIFLANKYLDDELTSKDIREIVSLKKQRPKTKLEKIMREFENIRDIKRYKIFIADKKLGQLLDFPSKKEAIILIKKKFDSKLGIGAVTKVDVKNEIIMIVLAEKGYRKLIKMATENKISKRNAILKILSH